MKRKPIKTLLIILTIQIVATYLPTELIKSKLLYTVIPIETYALPDKINTMYKLKEEIYTHISNREPTFEIVYKGSNKDITKESLDTTMNTALEDSYLRNSLDSWGYETESSLFNVKLTFNITYRTSKEEELMVGEKTSEILASIIEPNRSDFEKVKAINDYIVLHAEYSTNTSSSPYSPISILSEGRGVCLAYTLLAQKLLEKAGIESYIVEGETTEPHAWNLVKVDGEYYHLDTTWNDPLEDRKGKVQYDYFLVPDNVLSKDHAWIRENYEPATANSYSWIHNLRDAVSNGNKITYIDNYGYTRTMTFKIQTKLQTDLIESADSPQVLKAGTQEDSIGDVQEVEIKQENQSILSNVLDVAKTLLTGLKELFNPSTEI